MSKVALIGGGRVRTPFLIYGLNEAAKEIGVTELVLYDVDHERANLMCALGKAVIRRQGGQLRISISKEFDCAVADSSFVINSIRVGEMTSRCPPQKLNAVHATHFSSQYS